MPFTADWFSRHILTWERLLTTYKDTPVSFLELGCFQGMATTWMMDRKLLDVRRQTEIEEEIKKLNSK